MAGKRQRAFTNEYEDEAVDIFASKKRAAKQNMTTTLQKLEAIVSTEVAEARQQASSEQPETLKVQPEHNTY